MTMSSTCNTISGPSGWSSKWHCQFPFRYLGEIFTECVDTEKDETAFSWCSTKVMGKNRTHVKGHWGQCSPQCKCKTLGGPKDWKIGDKCKFPFEYSGNLYNGCIEYDIVDEYGNTPEQKGSWCSTKVHSSNQSHIHGYWAHCAKECPIERMGENGPCTTSLNSAKACGQCKFPFVMEIGGKMKNGCVVLPDLDLTKSHELWCPVQLDEHMRPRDKYWRLCTDDCTKNKNVSGQLFLTSHFNYRKIKNMEVKLITFNILK